MQALVAALGVAGAQAGPRGQVLGTRKPARIGADLGEDNLGPPAAHPGHRGEEVDGGLVGLQPLGNLGADPLQRLFEVVELAQVLGDQEGLVRPELPDHCLG